MGEGNLTKVNSIVDKIVEGNNVFKLKSLIEQDKEKDSIAQSINSALSVLNEIGKELVLQDLSIDPDEKFKGFIDNVGNVDISGLIKFTTTIVKEKIEEADKEGMNLRSGSIISTNGKNLIMEGMLTLAVLDTMIKNYDTLSNREVQILIKSYPDMPPERQDAFNKAQANKLRNIASEIQDEETKSALQKQAEITENLRESREDEIKVFSGCNLKAQIDIVASEFICLQEIISEFNKSGVNNSTIVALDDKIFEGLQNLEKTKLLEILSRKSPEKLKEIFEIIQKKKDEFTHQTTVDQDETYHKSNLSADQKLNRIRRNANLVIELTSNDRINEIIKGKGTKVKAQQIEASDKKEAYERTQISSKTIADVEIPNSSVEDVQIDFFDENKSINERILHEIQELPITLAENFTQEDISEALKMYAEMIESIPMTEYEDMISSEQIIEFFKAGLEPPQNEADKILEIIAQNDFGGKLKEILTNPELLQETFLPALQVEIQKLEQPEKAGVEQSEKTFEESKKVQPQVQSTTFNQETIRDELSAIPVALSNIEGIDKTDIIAGMQGYKQLLDSIDVSSLQGKSNEDVLRMLMERTASIGLEGNANEILLMMSQIGFSKDGNMQIADILAESKEAFTALVDEASKEENIDKAIQENQSQTPITDKEATPGMRLLIEDLSFAKENENQLGDQVVANDGAVSDTVSTSGSDDTQGNTASGKLKPKNLLGLIISRNVRTSNLQNPEQIMNEYSKDGKNETNKKQEKNEKIEDEFGK